MLESRTRKTYWNSPRAIENFMRKSGREGAPILGSNNANNKGSSGSNNHKTLPDEVLAAILAVVLVLSLLQFSLVFLPLWSVVIVPDSMYAYGYWIPALVILLVSAIISLVFDGAHRLVRVSMLVSLLLLFVFYCFGILKLTGVLPWDWPLLCIPIYVTCLFLIVVLVGYWYGLCN
jgi:hypothetical protein